MDSYLINRDTLAGYVDEIMKQKPAPVNTPEELNALREKSIDELGERITNAVAESLDETQLKEIATMMDDEATTEEAYQEFFDKAGVNVQQVLTDTIVKFGKDYLGGSNEKSE